MPRPNVSGENRAPLNPLARAPVSPEVNAPTGGVNPAVFNASNPLGSTPPQPAFTPQLPPVEGSPIADFNPSEMLALEETDNIVKKADPSRESAGLNMMQNMEAVWLEAILGEDIE